MLDGAEREVAAEHELGCVGSDSGTLEGDVTAAAAALHSSSGARQQHSSSGARQQPAAAVHDSSDGGNVGSLPARR